MRALSIMTCTAVTSIMHLPLLIAFSYQPRTKSHPNLTHFTPQGIILKQLKKKKYIMFSPKNMSNRKGKGKARISHVEANFTEVYLF